MSSKQALIDCQNLCYTIGEKHILKNINFQVQERDYVAIIGPNGGGKTTLVQLILGLIPSTHGTIKLLGQSPKKSRHHIGYLAQHHGHDFQFPILVKDVISMGFLKRGILTRPQKDDTEKLRWAAEKTQTADLLDQSFNVLSGGQKQRVLIARSLLSDPKCLILDEPTTGVDRHTEDCFYELLTELNKSISIIIVSHDISAIAREAKHVACLNQTMAYHGTKALMPKEIEDAYCCHVDLIAHGVHHRHLEEHDCDH